MLSPKQCELLQKRKNSFIDAGIKTNKNGIRSKLNY